MKKVAVVIYSQIVGGHEFQALELIKDISKKNEVDVFVDSSFNLERSEFMKLTNKIELLDLVRQGNFLKQLWHSTILKKSIRQKFESYDLIIVSGGSIEATIALGYALKGLNIFAYVPSFVDRSQLWKKKLGNLYNVLNYIFCRPFKKLITINRIQARLFSPYKKAVVLPNRIYDGYKDEIISDCSKEPSLYYVGRLEKMKGIVELIKYLDCPENPFPKLNIVGDGSLLNEIKVLADNCKYLKIELLGWKSKEEQERMFSKNDIYVTMSYMEGEPLAIREANQRGSIVIASNIDGHRGCVPKRNRFSTKEELIEKLNLAKKGRLKRSRNYTSDEVEAIRERAIQEICLQ